MSPKPHSESLEPFASFANPSTSNTAVDRYTTNVSNNTDAHKHGELANNKATEKLETFHISNPKLLSAFFVVEAIPRNLPKLKLPIQKLPLLHPP